MKLTRESFAELADQDIKEVEVPQWGATVCIRVLTAGEMSEIQSHGNDVTNMDFAARICAAGMCDEDGKPIADHKAILTKSQSAVVYLAEEIFKHNGIDEQEKN